MWCWLGLLGSPLHEPEPASPPQGGPDLRQPQHPPQRDLSSLRCSWHRLSVPLICSMFWEFVLAVLGISDKELSRATDGQTAELGRGSDLALRRNFQVVNKDASTRGRPGRGSELQEGDVSS